MNVLVGGVYGGTRLTMLLQELHMLVGTYSIYRQTIWFEKPKLSFQGKYLNYLNVKKRILFMGKKRSIKRLTCVSIIKAMLDKNTKKNK